MTNRLLKWYKSNKRNLPWRKTSNPYHIWVSEIILQQTQIKTGIKYYHKFLEKFPNIITLSNANEVDILNLWQGLGYYNRALNMLHAANAIKKNYNNVFPVKYDELIKLKGIGEYTAAAISSICANEKKAVLDGNVYRVLSRFYNINTPVNTSIGKKTFQNIANKLIPKYNTGTYNQAIMDFGSIHCKKHNPKCISCPFKIDCKSFAANVIVNRPVKNRKIKQKIRYFNYLLILDNDSFIIQQRTNKDIWNKLYELPLIESSNTITKSQLINHKIVEKLDILDVYHEYQCTHILSHQKLIISFWKINTHNMSVKRKLKKIQIKDIHKYPFPKPLEKYFDKQHLII